MVLNGRTPMKERDKIIKEFNGEGGRRVLIMSKVGVTGINLSRANHILILVSISAPHGASDDL
jgi:SNF2 family DNA or RNA helicase